MKKYISIIDCEYDIIFWNRHGLNETSGAENQYSYDFHINENSSKFIKLKGYLGFAHFAKKLIKEKKYDGIILTATNAGMFLRSTLRKHYRGRYIVDIRDYTMEKNFIFYQFEKSLLKNADFNVISSDGYKNFLPSGEYVTAHNELEVPIEIINKFRMRDKKVDHKIVLTYIGLIRFHDQNKKIIDSFCNDARFEVKFIGSDAFALKDYCEQKKANNIVLIDMFPPERTFDLLWETDIILNLYGNNTPLLDYALSNKLYYAAKLTVPILVCKGTYMEEISTKYGFGYTFDLDKSAEADKLYNYYFKIDWENFLHGCDQFIEKVNLDVEKFNNAIKKFSTDKIGI